MVETKEFAINVLSTVVALIVFIAKKSIDWTEFAYKTYPEATTCAFAFILIYCFYKASIRMVKFWVRMVFLTIKLLLILVTVIAGLLIYMRGWKFMQQDLPLMAQITSNYFKGKEDGRLIWSLPFQNSLFGSFGAPNDFKSASNKILNDYGIEIDTSYLEYMKRFNEEEESDYDKINDYFNEGLESLEDFIDTHGSKLQDFGKRLFGNL